MAALLSTTTAMAGFDGVSRGAGPPWAKPHRRFGVARRRCGGSCFVTARDKTQRIGARPSERALLLIMAGSTQHHYRHALLKAACTEPRSTSPSAGAGRHGFALNGSAYRAQRSHPMASVTRLRGDFHVAGNGPFPGRDAADRSNPIGLPLPGEGSSRSATPSPHRALRRRADTHRGATGHVISELRTPPCAIPRVFACSEAMRQETTARHRSASTTSNPMCRAKGRKRGVSGWPRPPRRFPAEAAISLDPEPFAIRRTLPNLGSFALPGVN